MACPEELDKEGVRPKKDIISNDSFRKQKANKAGKGISAFPT